MAKLRRMFTAASKATFNAIYKVARKKERSREVVFLSRQTNTPSYDFAELAREFARRDWRVTMHLKKVSNRNIPSYALHVLKELRLLGRCKLAVIDRYDPVICLLDFECEDYRIPEATRKKAIVTNRTFPIKPVVLQLWHAFGAYKKFGYQSVDTLEGHSSDFTDAYNIHRNYSWVVCSGESAREPFAEAFSCPTNRVIAYDRPEYDELMHARDERIKRMNAQVDDSFSVLMAPTLRISTESEHPFRSLYEHREAFERNLDCGITWSFHPLETGLPAPGNVSDQLLNCDLLVTDYSSIVYEAYLLGIPTLFYVPDIDEYRLSPGLNADPAVSSPSLCARNENELASLIGAMCDDPASYPREALEAFAASAFEIDVERQGSAASRLVDFAIGACEQSC